MNLLPVLDARASLKRLGVPLHDNLPALLPVLDARASLKPAGGAGVIGGRPAYFPCLMRGPH